MPDHDEPNDPSLGEPIRVFRTKLAIRVLIGFCGVIVVLVGIALFLTGSGRTGAYPIALGLLVVAVAFLIPKQQYSVCPGGVIVIRTGDKKWCRWEDIAEIIDQRVTHGIVSGRFCVVARKTGTKISISDTGISDFGTMIALLREQASAYNIPWKEEQVTK